MGLWSQGWDGSCQGPPDKVYLTYRSNNRWVFTKHELTCCEGTAQQSSLAAHLSSGLTYSEVNSKQPSWRAMGMKPGPQVRVCREDEGNLSVKARCTRSLSIPFVAKYK